MGISMFVAWIAIVAAAYVTGRRHGSRRVRRLMLHSPHVIGAARIADRGES